MKTIHIILATVVLGSAALAQDVTYNFDPAANFSSFHTYKWVEIQQGVRIDSWTAKQLDSAIQDELAKKGLTKTDSESPDLFIGYQVALDQERGLTAFGTGPRFGGMASAQTSTIDIGTLVLDMYDGKKALIWRGKATKTIDPGIKPEKRQKNIENGAAKLLKNYPPKTK